MDPSITVVGLGPAGDEYFVDPARGILGKSRAAFLRTSRHPAAAELGAIDSFDHHDDDASSADEADALIVADLVAAAQAASAGGDPVVYAVPGSPLVAERTVALLRADPRVTVTVVPALSFLDLAWARLGVDPVHTGVRVVDASNLRMHLAAVRGPVLVAQCRSAELDVELERALEDLGTPDEHTVTILFHLGLPDEVTVDVPWRDLGRAVMPDDLTSIWVPAPTAPAGAELLALEGLTKRLRAECPWDRKQTHASLRRYLLEESYETIDAIDALSRVPSDDVHERATAARHLEEELGDVLFQVYFHSRLAAEEEWFTLADVARGVHDKLVSRHPHVFGNVVVDGAATVVTNWEEIKKAEKGRESVTEGIPSALPALALAATLMEKAAGVRGVPFATGAEQGERVRSLLERVVALGSGSDDVAPGVVREQIVAEFLWAATDLVRRLDVDPEDALRGAARRFVLDVRAAEVRALQ